LINKRLFKPCHTNNDGVSCSSQGIATIFGLLRVAIAAQAAPVPACTVRVIAPKSALHSRRSRRPKISVTYQRSNQGIAIISLNDTHQFLTNWLNLPREFNK